MITAWSFLCHHTTRLKRGINKAAAGGCRVLCKPVIRSSNGTADAHSDVDLKIEKGALRSLFQICGFRLAVEDALKLPVDLVTSESSDKSFLDMIKKDEVLLYRNA